MAFVKEYLPFPHFPLSSNIQFCLLKKSENWLLANVSDFTNNYWKDGYENLHICKPYSHIPENWENLGFGSIILKSSIDSTVTVDRKNILCLKDSKKDQIQAYLEENKLQNRSENIVEGLLVPIRLSNAKCTDFLPTLISNDSSKISKEKLISLINTHEIISFMGEEETLPIKYENMKFCLKKMCKDEWEEVRQPSPITSIWIDQCGKTQELSPHKSNPKGLKFKGIKSVSFIFIPKHNPEGMLHFEQVEVKNILCFAGSNIRLMNAFLFRNNVKLNLDLIMEVFFMNIKQLINNHLTKFQVIAFKNIPGMNSSIHAINIDTLTLPDEDLETCLVKRSNSPYWSIEKILKRQQKPGYTNIYVKDRGSKYYKDIWCIPSSFESMILNSVKKVLKPEGNFTQSELSDILCNTYNE